MESSTTGPTHSCSIGGSWNSVAIKMHWPRKLAGLDPSFYDESRLVRETSDHPLKTSHCYRPSNEKIELPHATKMTTKNEHKTLKRKEFTFHERNASFSTWSGVWPLGCRQKIQRSILTLFVNVNFLIPPPDEWRHQTWRTTPFSFGSFPL